MTAAHETTPYSGDPDEFDLIAGELIEQMEDAYLTDMHREVHSYEQMLERPGSDNPLVRQQIIAMLDDKWRYMGQSIGITGKAWVKVVNEPGMLPRTYIDEQVVSRGFIFLPDDVTQEIDGFPKIGHYAESVNPATGDRYQIVITPEDLEQMNLPTMSPEARERRFAYNHETQSDWLDDIAFTTPRADQIIPSLREFYYDVNLYDSDEVEDLRDATEYMRRRAEIEPHATYRVSFMGDVIVIDNEQSGIPTQIAKPSTYPMRIKDIVLRPADITVAKLEGLQRCVPFIDATAFRSNGTDIDLLIPCSSILWMHSLRYDSTP